MKISFVIPTYQRFPQLVQTIQNLLKEFPQAEIIIVNDGSKDETKKIVEMFPAQIIYLENKTNQGKGISLRKGFLQATGDFIIFTDDDLPYGVEGIKKIIDGLEEGYDIVIGKRQIFYNDSFFKALLRPVLYVLLKLFFSLYFTDTQAGLKGFKKEAGKKLFQASIIFGFAIDIEILYLARRCHYKIKEVPVIQREESFLPSTFNLKRIIEMFFELLKIKLHRYEI